jgi:hypothetical protein
MQTTSTIILSTLALLMLTSAASAHSPAACAQPTDPTKELRTFVGKSAATSSGHHGLLGWLDICRTEFPGSRVCSTRDLIENRNLPELADNEWIWIVPYWLNDSHDYSGAQFDRGVCAVLANNPNIPPTRIAEVNCDSVLQVACCN